MCSWHTFLLLSQLNDLFTSSQQDLEATSQQLEQTTANLAATTDQLCDTRKDLRQTRVERDERGFLVDEHVRSEQALLGEAGQVIISHGRNTAVPRACYFDLRLACLLQLSYYIVITTIIQ